MYAYIDGQEKFTYLADRVNSGIEAFFKTRPNDPRANPVQDAEDLYCGDAFYIACIDTPEKLAPMYEKYRDSYHCIYQKELYTQFQWLEIMPKETTKANAAVKLKELLGCDRIVAFGDGKNDMDLFRIADECYAVGNAVEELKVIATDVIGTNDADGVAHWVAESAV